MKSLYLEFLLIMNSKHKLKNLYILIEVHISIYLTVQKSQIYDLEQFFTSLQRIQKDNILAEIMLVLSSS